MTLPNSRKEKAPLPRIRTFVLKIVSRCNLNCTYCYVYNKGDTSWQTRPGRMPDKIIQASLKQIRDYSIANEIPKIRITFHGGEPTLFGSDRFAELCEYVRAYLNPVDVRFAIQTNGTLIDSKWATVLAKHGVNVGVSIDGPAVINDRHRIDHKGRGTFQRVAEGVKRLRDAGVQIGSLCVIPFGENSVQVHQTIKELGFHTVDYLFPDVSEEEHAAIQEKYGPRPVAAFLLPLLEYWWNSASMDDSISIFMQVARLILGGSSTTDTFGGGAQPYLFIETDGALEGLDVLRTCEDRLSSSGITVTDHSIEAFIHHPSLAAQALRGEILRPTSCESCSEYETCGGGYLPHRYRRDKTIELKARFNNPSVWCEDIQELFKAMRTKLEVSPEETRLRALALNNIREETRFKYEN